MSAPSSLRRRSVLRSLLATCGGIGIAQQAQSIRPQVLLAQAPVRLAASGRSFATPLYQAWFEIYGEENSELRLTYTPGSFRQGIEDLQLGAVDFAMSDAGISADEAREIGGVVAIPIVAGAVGIAYNLPGIDENLRLTRRLLSEIYLGEIRAWNDERIAELNPKVELPSLPITVLYQGEADGYNQILTRYLNAISRDWAAQVGSGAAVEWPVGEPVRPQEDLARRLALTFGGITAVGLELMMESPLTLARLENRAGKFIMPMPTTIASGLTPIELDEERQGFVADPLGEESYPLVSYTWILTYPTYGDAAKLEALQDLLGWCLTEGQPIAAESGFVPLSGSVIETAQAALDALSLST